MSPPEQTSLDFRPKGVPRSHRRDPDTSRVAARAMTGPHAKHHQTILAALGDERLTAHEISARTTLDPVQVNRRLSEMRELGLVERLPETRKSPAGHPAHLHRRK